MSRVAERLSRVHDQIERAAQSAGRTADSVTLIAVTKTVSVDLIQEAYAAGQRDFGESRLQEALPKIQVLPTDVRWHFIGTLQSNKAKAVGNAFQVVHSVESERHQRDLAKSNREIDVLIEVNIGREQQKSGVSPNDLAEIRKSVLQWKVLHLRGLMGIGPAHRNAEDMRPYFRELRALNDSIGGEWLSMGMSNDFEVAIQEGSTHVRVGSAIFGERQGTAA